jgi:AAA domain
LAKRLKIAQLDARGKVVVEGPLLKALTRVIDKHKFDIVCIDPVIKAHSLGESDNGQMDAFATMLADLSQERNIAVDLLAHERKAGVGANAPTPGDANRSRGASSYKDAQRLGKTITWMSESEAKGMGVSDETRLSLVRIDNAKNNLTPPARKAMWFKIVSVNLGNGTPTYPNGDNVQAAEPWEPPPLMAGTDNDGLNAALRQLGEGMDDGRRYSTANAAKDRAAWKVLQEQFPDFEEAKCRSILAMWKKNGMFKEGEYDDPVRERKAKGILSAKQIERLPSDEDEDD